jgi:P27 family predicted phage terminase small subunit
VPPAWLEGDARRVFAETVAAVSPGFFRPCDLELLIAYSQSVARYHAASEILDREGLVLDGKPHPAYLIVNKERAGLKQLAQALRIAPSARRDGKTANNATDIPQTGALAALAYLERKHG